MELVVGLVLLVVALHHYFLDVTSTSDIKVKFNALSIASGSAIVGDSSIIRTGFTFIRMGDT